MKKLMTLATFLMFVALAFPAAAQTVVAPSGHDSHGAQEAIKALPQAPGQSPHAGHGAVRTAPEAAAVPPNAHDHSAGQHGRMMDGHMEKMQGLMEKIRATADPAERRKLVQEQMAAMRDGMKMMKEAPGCPMMAGGMKGRKPGQMAMKQKGMGPMMMCHQLMEKNLAMMQVMMEGLIEASQEKS